MQEKHYPPPPKPPHIWHVWDQKNQNKGIEDLTLNIDSHCPYIYYLEKPPPI